ncbi:MAG: zinc-binding dehydrogenase, partial [Pseudomonadota bacterium]
HRDNLCPSRQIISMPPRDGAFAQYIAMPAKSLVDVPDTVPIAKAALAEPLAVSWHAARLALVALPSGLDASALVIGGGAIGLAAALALHAMGVTDVTIAESNAARRTFLTNLCHHHVVAQTEGSFPIVVDAVGFSATRAMASARAAPGGVIAHVGLGEDTGGLDIRRMTLQEITFVGTYAYTAQDFRDAAAALFDGRLGPLDWIEERGIDEGAQAFADLRAGSVAAPKIVLDPWA